LQGIEAARIPPEVTGHLDALIGRRVSLPGYFDGDVTVEAVRELGSGVELRVRRAGGELDEAVVSADDFARLLTTQPPPAAGVTPADAEGLRLLVESARIRLAYVHDRQFAVSLSGIKTLPHQIEAVYLRMLPQPRLRFLLADDPGAGKTIMAGLLVKELKLREAIDRCLILVPAPLTIQWQDELLRFFGESFQIIHSGNDQQQLLNLWQREPRVIASLDYAKQDDVRERVWQQRWDLVIVDEAHKCSAYTKRSATRGDEVEKTRRYQLAERLAAMTDHLLMLTATPHHGDDDRFGHFVRLLDADLFPETHKVGDAAGQIRRDILRLGSDCPWALRRLKEDLKDVTGRRLFPDRHAHTVTFKLGPDEFNLYKAVTAYINEFLPQASGSRRNSVALARTVFQRRLASSTRAIHESLTRRLRRLQDVLDELERLSQAQRARRLAQLQGRVVDVEQDEDDLDEAARDQLLDETTATLELDQLRGDVAALRDLVARAARVREHAADSKLSALRDCLDRAEFRELKDGRGKLLVFTEHRDTLAHVREHLEAWGYSTCEIHGGMNPHERKHAQEEFRTARQVCIATEAAGEGINLQFCHLMINYDLPWNPTRLEQRLGRIHRIGQDRECHAFNFVAAASEDGQPVIEGRILERLLGKLEQMRAVLADRVFDVIGEILSLNDVNLPEMLREAAYEPRRLDEYLDQIDRIDPAQIERYERATGIALARATVDFSAFLRTNVETEERRLMPRYVEAQFIKAAEVVGLKVAPRADRLWRVEHVPAELRSERRDSVRRLGTPDASYRKLTFHKDQLDDDAHVDAVLLGPGHPLYAVVDERLDELLAPLHGGQAVYVDALAEAAYRLHFFEIAIRGESGGGEPVTLHAELVAVREEIGPATHSGGRLSVFPADALVDLPAHPSPPGTVAAIELGAATDFLKTTVQMARRTACQEERKRYATVCRDYLTRSFDARTRAAQDRVMTLRAREAGSPEVALARQRAEQELVGLGRTRDERLAALDRLVIVRHGPVRHVASALVLPPSADATAARVAALVDDVAPELRRRIELAAENVVMAYEAACSRECERVGHLKIGFDVRSLAPADPQTGYRDPVLGVRRIEVKGRQRGQPVRLTTNEWYKATQLGDSYWLYVVWNPLDHPDPVPVMVQNPAKHLDHVKRELVAARCYDLPADAIEAIARAQVERTS
jgi:superfamily II DNA or RNA helicase